MAKRRHNIGLLVASITDNYSNRVAMGAMEAAKRLDANLVIFPGKNVDIQHINHLYKEEYEYQFNVLFDLAAQAKLDYLIIVVGAILFAHPPESHKEFLDRLGNTPILSVSSRVEGYDSLQFDNRSGVKAAVNYLASHGRRHIGIIAGELSNDEFVQRYKAYRQAMEDNGLEFRDSYMIPCSLAHSCHKEARQLLDLNPELDAIICGNDIIAYDLYEVLKERNIRIGIDMAVVGFDDLPADLQLDPPLASVRANAVELGQSAIEKAVNLLNGVKDERRYLDAQFIPRRSCFKYVDDYNVPEKVFFGDFSDMVGHVDNFFAEKRINAAEDDRSHHLVVDFLHHLQRHYMGGSVGESTVEETVSLLDQAVPLKQDREITRILYGAYIWFLRNCPVENIPYIQMLHQRFRADKNGESVRSVTKKFEERSHMDNVFIRDALTFSGNLTDSCARILGKLEGVGAVSAFLYTFDEPIIHNYGDRFPEQVKWSFEAYSNGADVAALPKDKPKLSTPEVFNNDHLWQDRQRVFIVADLFSAETQYGIALLEPRDKEFFEELELVTYELSSAVRTLNILKKQKMLLEELHTTNLALDEMSKIDELTRVYNRRGFYPAADKLISDPQHQGKSFIVCYADMDNLKMVNDTYGHGEGDFAIKLLAQFLARTFGEDAVIGRMGGDEFAAVLPASAEVSIETLTGRMKQLIREFNESREKPYYFDTSIGMVESACGNSYDLKAAFDKADDLLYIEKSQKKKEENGGAYNARLEQFGRNDEEI